MEERRKFLRVSEKIRIGYKIKKGFLRTETRSNDLSPGGICFSVPQRLGEGVVLEMTLYLSDSAGSIEALGKVVWTMPASGEHYPFTIGVEFIDMSPEDQKRIMSLLKTGG